MSRALTEISFMRDGMKAYDKTQDRLIPSNIGDEIYPKMFSCSTVLRLVALAPIPHGVQNGLQAVPQIRQCIFHPGRNLRIDSSGKKSAALHLSQLSGQNFLRYMAGGFFEFTKAFRAGEQVP